jgi:hypothetical protein
LAKAHCDMCASSRAHYLEREEGTIK